MEMSIEVTSFIVTVILGFIAGFIMTPMLESPTTPDQFWRAYVLLLAVTVASGTIFLLSWSALSPEIWWVVLGAFYLTGFSWTGGLILWCLLKFPSSMGWTKL